MIIMANNVLTINDNNEIILIILIMCNNVMKM